MKVLVVGSNEKGIQGSGGAADAFRDYGAVWGEGFGYFTGGKLGNCYLIPTKSTPDRGDYAILSEDKIREYVSAFTWFAAAHPELTFDVTAIGCGRARPSAQSREFRVSVIAPMFAEAYKLKNVNLPVEFINVLSRDDGESRGSVNHV